MNRILDLNDDYESVSQNKSERRDEVMKNSNLFMNLNDNPVNDDFFEICDENEEINFGQSSLNLQFR